MSNTITIESKQIPIDNFEAQQSLEGKVSFYVVRTSDTYSPTIYANLNASPQSISLSSGKGAPSFTIASAVINNYQYSTAGENSTKEFFHVTGTSVTMKIAES